MQIIQRARGMGKTTEAVKLTIKKGYDILVFNDMEKKRLLKIYTDLKPDQVFTADQLLRGDRRGMHKYGATVIDNAELVLRQIVPNAKLMTITDYSKE